jgi:Glycosyltransferase family 87
MTRTRRIALAWILLASGISIWWGFSVGQAANGWVDFRAVYYGTRCLLQHHNPYNVSELEGVYRAEGGERPSETVAARQAVVLYVNVPTTFIVVTPFAMLPWGPAHLLWVALTAGVFILASLLMWNLGESYAPDVSLFLIFILLANCESIFGAGNTAGIAVGLCVVAVWCFLRERFVPAGILCLALSLAIKPHDAGLVWLYFLLAGGVYRKRALQTLIITAVLGLSAFLWLSHVAPHWMQDWQSNLSIISAPGGINEPGPSALTGRSAFMVIDLQAAISVFRDDPRIYNPASYLFCGVLLLLWAARTLRSSLSLARAWIALAAIVPLTMLITYHRPWDAKLLMLTVPACALLWAEGGPIAWIALLVNSAGLLLTGDIPLAILNILSNQLHLGTSGIFAQMLTVVLIRPASLILLAMSIFYLWAYLRREFPQEKNITAV